MKSKVEAGLLSSIADIIKSISSIIAKGLDYLYKIGIETEDVEKTPEGGLKFKVKTPQDNKFDVNCKPTSRKGYFDMEFKSDDGDSFTEKNVKEADIQKVILKVIKDWWGESAMKDSTITEASNTIRVGLKKVAATDGSEIHMTSIMCGTDFKVASDMVDAILNDDEFVAEIPEEATLYDLVDDGDNIDVEVVADPDDGYVNIAPAVAMLAAAINLKDDLQCIHWNAKGKQFNNIHEYLNGAIDALSEQIDYIAESCVEFYGWCPHSGDLPKTEPLQAFEGFSNTEGFAIVRDKIHEFVDCLELMYCNFESDYQSIMDDWIRYWKKEADYFIARRLISQDM